MNWTEDDLRKPQVLVESAYGHGHPGTFHFRDLIEEVSNGVFEMGGKPADFVVSDICDGRSCACSPRRSRRGGSSPARRSRTRSSCTRPPAARRTPCCTLPPIAEEAGVEITIDDFDRIHRQVPVLGNVKSTGRYPVEYFWYAGGVPALMLQLRDLLHLDCLTVTGKTVGENLEEIEHSKFFMRERLGYLKNFRIDPTEIIRPPRRRRPTTLTSALGRDDPFGPDGGIAILRGNLAPEGAMAKTCSVPQAMRVHTGRARVFEDEDEAIQALVERVLVIRYEGPRARGMPELYFAAAILSPGPLLNTTTALVTDGRYSGTMQGPCIRHVAPEALDGGPNPAARAAIARVIQAPLMPQTRHLFDEAQLRRMKPSAILINTARGPIVEDRALHRALSEGWIAGAGLDDMAR